jgi:hypothetical protein
VGELTVGPAHVLHLLYRERRKTKKSFFFLKSEG